MGITLFDRNMNVLLHLCSNRQPVAEGNRYAQTDFQCLEAVGIIFTPMSAENQDTFTFGWGGPA